jgi:hypothetical protein
MLFSLNQLLMSSLLIRCLCGGTSLYSIHLYRLRIEAWVSTMHLKDSPVTICNKEREVIEKTLELMEINNGITDRKTIELENFSSYSYFKIFNKMFWPEDNDRR